MSGGGRDDLVARGFGLCHGLEAFVMKVCQMSASKVRVCHIQLLDNSQKRFCFVKVN